MSMFVRFIIVTSIKVNIPHKWANKNLNMILEIKTISCSKCHHLLGIIASGSCIVIHSNPTKYAQKLCLFVTSITLLILNILVKIHTLRF